MLVGKPPFASAAPHADFLPVEPAGDRCRRELPGDALGIGPTYGVAVADASIYAIGGGQLTILRADRPQRDAVIGRIAGLGSTRQIAVSRGHVFVTSRDEGVFVVDGGTVTRSGWVFSYPMDTECGATPWKDGWIATSRQGFFFLKEGETRSPREIGLHRPGGGGLPGKPTACGETLFIADPFSATSRRSISRIRKPRRYWDRSRSKATLGAYTCATAGHSSRPATTGSCDGTSRERA